MDDEKLKELFSKYGETSRFQMPTIASRQLSGMKWLGKCVD